MKSFEDRRKDVDARVEEVAFQVRVQCPRMAIHDYEEVKKAVRSQWMKHHGLDPLGRERWNRR